jgi:hypothetical protein
MFDQTLPTSQCIVCEGVFGIQEHCGGSTALIFVYSLPEDQNCLQGHYFKTTNNIQKAVTNTLKDFTEEDFCVASRDGRNTSSGLLLLKGTTWEGITLKWKNFSNNFFNKISLIAF